MKPFPHLATLKVLMLVQTCEKNAYDQYHKLECPIFRSLHPRILPNAIRAVLRILLYDKSSNPYTYPVASISATTWKRITDIRSDTESFRKIGGKRWEELCVMTQCAMEYSGTTQSFETVVGIFCSVSAPKVNQRISPTDVSDS